jgi:N-acetylglutamate synthase-like GNAT family acetyltransferase
MEADQWIIRRAQSADAVEMKTCVKAAYRHYIARMGKPPGPMLDDYSEMVEQHQAFVAEESGRVIGILVLILKNDGILMDNVAVLPKYQGKGLGHQLVQFAETQAFERGFKSLYVYTHELMTENIEMYKRLGYVETKRCTEKGYRRVYMRKRLL